MKKRSDASLKEEHEFLVFISARLPVFLYSTVMIIVLCAC